MKKLLFSIAFGTIVIDITTKLIAQEILANTSIHILWDFFSLRLVYNPGIAFGIETFSWMPLKILTIWLIIAGFLYISKQKNITKTEAISYGLIMWWAIWNAIERIFVWKVTDMFALKYFSIFNIADIAITIGAILFLYFAFFLDNKK